MRASVLVGTIVMAGAAWACGGSGGSSATPTGPASAATTTIDILGQKGAASFSPNPAPVEQGNMTTWRNMDSVTHHIVLNDGSLDTGDIAPGASSAALRMAPDGANYHCTIHPAMIGSIKGSSGTPPPCQGVYC
jgi:plastocyanin